MDSKGKHLVMVIMMLALYDLTQAKGKGSKQVRRKWFSFSVVNSTLTYQRRGQKVTVLKTLLQ